MSRNKCTQTPQCRERAGGARKSPHEPCNAARGPRKPREVHPNPSMQRADQEAKIRAHKPCEAKGKPGEPKQVHTSPATQSEGLGNRDKCTQISVTQRAQEKIHISPYLVSFGQQCRAGRGMIPGISRGLVAVKIS